MSRCRSTGHALRESFRRRLHISRGLLGHEALGGALCFGSECGRGERRQESFGLLRVGGGCAGNESRVARIMPGSVGGLGLTCSLKVPHAQVLSWTSVAVSLVFTSGYPICTLNWAFSPDFRENHAENHATIPASHADYRPLRKQRA